jgi:uncharacterized phage protein (TIGR02218 family)
VKNVSPELEAHLQQETTTLATCIKVTLTNGEVYGFTDHDQPLVIDGLTYSAESGYTATAIQSNHTLAVDNLDIEALLDSPIITEADLLAGKWNYAEVEMFMVNYEDLSMGSLKLRKGTTGETKIKDTSFMTELRGMTQPLQQVIGELYSASCRVKRFGDERCGVDRSAHTFEVEVQSVEDPKNFTIDGTYANNLFDYGEVEFTSGLNNGVLYEVKTNVNNAITLQLTTVFPIEVGDTLKIVKGCNRTVTSCKSYNNILNFRGEPYIPGPDKILKGPR